MSSLKGIKGRRMRRWLVYYQSREYARVMGDPCLGYVVAASRAEALAVARDSGVGSPDGVHVVPASEPDSTLKEIFSSLQAPQSAGRA